MLRCNRSTFDMAMYRVLLITVVFIITNTSSSQEIESTNNIKREPKLASSKMAVNLAHEVLSSVHGNLHVKSMSLIASIVDNTPFLADRFRAGNIWHVVIENYKVDQSSHRPGEKDKYNRTIDLYLDATTGGILKIITRWPVGVSKIPPEPSAESVEDQMKRSGNERYHAFVGETPPITLSDALDAVAQAGGDIFRAKQIKAQYVLWSKLGYEQRPVWAITLRGIAPFPAAFPGVSKNARNHLRYIIDGRSGKWLSASSVPQPETEDNE